MSVLAWADEQCSDVYTVEPKNKNYGGTIYRSSRGEHPVNGYLSRGSLLKFIKENDEIIMKEIENQEGESVWHSKFVGADGSFGYVRTTETKPLKEKFEERASEVNCKNPDELLAIPANYNDDVILYKFPKKELTKPKRINSFSRTWFFPVIFSGKIKKIKYKDDEGEIISKNYYHAYFFQDEGDKYRKRNILLDKHMETIRYHFIPINPQVFLPINRDVDTFI